MFSNQFDALMEAIKLPWQEYLYWWAQIALTVIALVSAVLAYVQLSRLSHTARATFLLDLDRRWDGAEMVAARKLLNATLDTAKLAVAQKHTLANDGERERLVGIEFAEALKNLRATDTDKYQSLMSICGFFETAGLMVEKKYCPANDFIGLFGGPLATINTCYRKHIEQRQKEMGVLAGLYEHALKLSSKVGDPTR